MDKKQLILITTVFNISCDNIIFIKGRWILWRKIYKKINRINSYLIGLSLVNFIIFGFYYFIYSGPGIKGNMPLYMKIYLIVSLYMN